MEPSQYKGNQGPLLGFFILLIKELKKGHKGKLRGKEQTHTRILRTSHYSLKRKPPEQASCKSCSCQERRGRNGEEKEQKPCVWDRDACRSATWQQAVAHREESFRRSKEAQSISLSLKAYLGSGQYLKEKRRKGNSYAFLRKSWQTQPKIMAAHEECIKGQKF